MKVFEVKTNDGNKPVVIEARHYYEDGSFVVFSTGLEGICRSDERVASFNKMSITSIVKLGERIDAIPYEDEERSGKDECEYERAARSLSEKAKDELSKAIIYQQELSAAVKRGEV